MNKARKLFKTFSAENEGVQVIEYALIIAVVALVFVIALRDVTGTNFSGFINRVANCLSNQASCG